MLVGVGVSELVNQSATAPPTEVAAETAAPTGVMEAAALPMLLQKEGWVELSAGVVCCSSGEEGVNQLVMLLQSEG